MANPRLSDISEALGISVSAVSMALDDHPRIGAVTRKRVQHYCQEIGYISADKLASRRLKRQSKQAQKQTLRFAYVPIGDRGADPDDIYVVELANTLRRNGHALELIPLELSQPADAVSVIEAEMMHFDALLLTNQVSVSMANAVTSTIKRCVVLGNIQHTAGDPAGPAACPRVSADVQSMGYQSADYLIRRGHRHIGFHSTATAPGSYNAEWLAGCRQALVAAGLPINPDLEFLIEKHQSSALVAARYFASRAVQPTAIVMPSDWLAQPFLEIAHDLGLRLSPSEIVIGGLRSKNAARGAGHLPQVTQDVEQICRMTAQALVWTARGELSGPVDILIPGIPWNLETASS